jgi:5'-3' exonuclease
MDRKALIFDGTNTFLRNFVVNPTMDHNGEPIGGLIGTIRSIKWMVHEVRPTKVLFVWDGVGGSRRRRGVFAEYKMGRKPRLNRELDDGSPRDSKQNMDWQMSKLKGLLGFLGVQQLEIDDIEADDTIGYLVGLLDPTPKVIVSGDKDMWQLVSPTTTVYWPTKKVFITSDTFLQHASVLPYNYVLLRALKGDADRSDNIKGIKGLGEKTILKLLGTDLEVPIDLPDLIEQIRHYLKLDADGKKKLRPTEKRWFQAILDHRDLLSQNVAVMQLSVPNISARAAGIIRGAAASLPAFNATGFKLALLNNSIQITDPDIFTVFQEYRQRASVLS